MILSPIFSHRFVAVTNDYVTGSGNDTVPSGATQLLIEVRSAGGSGRKNGASGNTYAGGGGAYGSKTIALVAADWGVACPYVCGAPGVVRTTVTNGQDAVTSSFGPITLNGTSHAITATGGKGGTTTNGLGGTSSGGTTNISGGNGTGGINGGSWLGGTGANAGGAGGPESTDGDTPGGGGGYGINNGVDINDNSGAGGLPKLRFAYT